MGRSFFLVRVGVALALVASACSGNKDPDPCPVLPPCITGSTWNATTCACVLEDEVPDAGNPSQDADASSQDADASSQEADAAPEIDSRDAGEASD